MSVAAANRGARTGPLALAAVFCVALGARLVPLLQGGGLYALGNYDDGVHFAAAVGLVHGLLPYQDFLLLHPPGVVLALAPFAALAALVGEPDAMAVARLCWMALGGLNAVLCAVVMRPLGRSVAVVTGLGYALCYGAVYVEHTVLLEPPATTVLLAALVLTRALDGAEGVGTGRYVAAGLLLGLSPTLKIWGVLAVLVVAGGLAYRRGPREGLTVLLGAVTSCTLVCLPFFMSAPKSMWQLVVVDQVTRRRSDYQGPKRVNDVLGLTLWSGRPPVLHLGTAVVVALLLAALTVCVLRPRLRLLAALLASHLLLLSATPMWFLHYAGLTAAPLVLVLGGGLAALSSWAATVRTWLGPCVVALAAVVVLVSALPLTQHRLSRPFPGEAAARLVAGVEGCLVTDHPMTLIKMDLLRRQLDRKCRYEVDLGGASYRLEAGRDKDRPRARNPVWQAYALEYLRTGEAAIIARFSSGDGFSPRTA